MPVDIKKQDVTTSCPKRSSLERLDELKKGLAYTPEELAEEWGRTEKSVNDAAKKRGCFCWVRNAAGKFDRLIVHPDTAADLGGQRKPAK